MIVCRGVDLLFCVYVNGDHRDLPVLTHSFPTRRSSDLRILTAASDRANETVLIGIAKLRADAKKRRDERSLEHLAPMIIGPVGETRHAGGKIGRAHV